MKIKKYTVEDLLEKASSYLDQKEDLEKIRYTYSYAYEKHKGQFRKSGEEYIIHPLNVAIILTGIYADCDTLCAALLHDVVEDCDVELSEIEEKFGKDIAFLVDGVTKLSRINFSTENEYLIEYYKKIIVGMSEDVRVIIIKLADRVHNMRTLWAIPPDRQKAKAKETSEIFYDIAEKLNNTKLEREKAVNEMMGQVTRLLNEHDITHEIKGRAKSIYSIYKKLDKGKKFSDIYDLLALRVFVNTEAECYQVLGLIHSKFRPLPKRFKDYVAMPKPNMYQSLHTTIFGYDGYLFEIQIRTYEMDEIAENGIASHWAYKEKGKDAKALYNNKTERKLQFFKSIMELNEEKMSSEEFVNSVKDEVLNNNIYVYTPKGDVIELPKGATPVDFAYKVHTKVGETMVGALVNGAIASLDYELKNNDIVKINTSKTSTGPKKEWLNFVKCTQTKNKIKSFFVKTEREVYIERGKEALEKELRKQKIAFNDFLTEENKKEIFEKTKVESLEDLYLHIGNNKFAPKTVINFIYKHEESMPQIKQKTIIKSDDCDIIVEGIDNIKVNLANCCNPIPGDDIIGYITKGNGISVHRRLCPNVAMLNRRIIHVEWYKETTKKYIASLMIYTNTKENKIFDIIQKASIDDIVVEKINTHSKENLTEYELDCFVRNLEHLNKYINDLNHFTYITNIERLIR